MGQTPDKRISIAGLRLHQNTADREFDLNAFLHPGRVFAHPTDVVHDSGLSLQEKRAILASWASDACALESAPALRRGPPGGKPVNFDEVMDALRMLDGPSGRGYGGAELRSRREAARRRTPLPFARARIWRAFRGSGSENEPSSGVPSVN
jgi:hypothetical protein